MMIPIVSENHIKGKYIVLLVFLILIQVSSSSECNKICDEGYTLDLKQCQCYSLEQQTSCPIGSVYMNDKCRKIVCPSGEFYNGICLKAMCPPGLVWREKKCQKPGYVTTILEIENEISNELFARPTYLEETESNEVVRHESNQLPEATTTSKPNNISDFETLVVLHKAKAEGKSASLVNATNSGCCTVRTPRICKRYGEKWICFNRSKNTCDSRVCTSKTVYLTPPEIKYQHPILTMPPADRIPAIVKDGNNMESADCSGCASNHPENCSSYCYLYWCPSNTCAFMDLDLYCSYYSGRFGCTNEDGCLWNWC